jgi:AcrR family transcriptional regulator
LVSERGLNGLSLDEVAARSGASRATVYRFYPGKAALFRAVVLAYLPVDEAIELLEASADRPPIQVMGLLARTLAQAGHVRIGVLRSVLFEMVGPEDGSEEFLADALRSTQAIIRYLEQQMAAGRLRRMDPVLAMQAFLAPIMFHVVSRPLIEEYGLTTVSIEEAGQEFTDAWLRAMTVRRSSWPRASSEPPPARRRPRARPGPASG